MAGAGVSGSDEQVLDEARDAIARHDWATALDRAGSRSFEAGSRAEADRADLHAEAAWWLGRIDDCIASRELAYRTYDELGEHQRAGQCAVWLWEHHAIAARPSVAGGWLRRARRSLDGERDCVAYGNLLLREGEVAHGGGELDRAVALADEVIALGRSLRSTDLEAEALQMKGRLLITQGRIAEGMAHLDEAMLFAVEGRLGPFSTGKVYCSLISACEDVGDYDRAVEWTEATLQWSQRHPFAIFPGICRVHRAMVLKRRGSLAEAEQEALRASQELITSHVGNSAAALAEVGDIRRRLGDLDQAEAAFDQAQALRGSPCAELALLRLAQGRPEAARSVIANCGRSTADPFARARLLPIQIHVAIALGDLDGAQAALGELDDIRVRFDNPSLAAVAESARGRLQLAQGSSDASATLQRALDRWRALDVPYEVASAQTLLGQALREAGDEVGAMEAFTSAVDQFEQIGARLDARRVLHDSPPPLPAGLTAREVEVLRLIADGLTNNQIAAELHLSVKTVSRHLSNNFTKIGVSTRASATAFAFEHDLAGGA
jgi:ATP/maltotriose-dependent transcriptional regulator MalT